jgi:hypothetical protein
MSTSKSENHWKELAESLGMEVPEEPVPVESEQEETPDEVSSESVEVEHADERLEDTEPTAYEPESVVAKRPQTSWQDIAGQLGVDVPAESMLDTSAAENVELVREETGEAVEETAFGTEADVEQFPGLPETDEPQRFENILFDSDLETAKSGDFVAEALEAAEDIDRDLDQREMESSTEETGEEIEERPRRRRRRRGRSRRGSDRENRGERQAEESVSEDTDSASEEDTDSTSEFADEDRSEPHIKHRKIPTWQEAISVLVDTNIKAREKSSGGRGGSRGGRRGRGRK